MKRRGLVLFFVGVVLFGAFSVQNANAQSANVAHKIIGTWAANDRKTWVFNANVTGTCGTDEFKFGVTDTQLAIQDPADYGKNSHDFLVFDISISSDGKTLIMKGQIESRSTSGILSGFIRYNYWLTKK